MVFHHHVGQLGFGSVGSRSCTKHCCYEPKTVGKHTSICTRGSFAVSPSSSHYKMPSITVLHIRMLPRLPQRTKQSYAKQPGVPTYIVMRQCEKRKAGAGRGVKHDGGDRKVGVGGPQGSLLALKRGTCGDTTPTR